jgi:uncharacterized membrane protein HdeD (DUF308 family)
MESFTLFVVNWKGMMVRGVLSIILGLIIALLPGPTLIAVTILIGIFVLMLGLMGLAMFLSIREGRKRAVLLLEGALGIIFGVMTIIWPNITALLLIFILGVWCLVEGLVQLYAGLMMRRKASLRAVVYVSGILSVVIGLIFIFAPGEGAIAFIWLIGLFAIAYGVLSIVYGMFCRSYFQKEMMAKA